VTLGKGILDHAPTTSWWTEAQTPEEFYARARQEYQQRLWRQRGSVQSFEAAVYGGRMSRPTRTRGAE
jgi:hypothetical protein